MKGGRKNLKRAAKEKTAILQQGLSIMQVVDLRGSNLIEVMDANGEKSLAIFPAKFQKSMWIKRGNFVVVDESGREEAMESGRKVGCIVTQVLFYDQVREYQKSPEWPEIFKSAAVETSSENFVTHTCQAQDIENLSDDDGLPPLEANTNRLKPFQSESETESDSEVDS
ncbi:PREDICTED: probable RNA-binding protein EIF1AD [Ipomoea nil]|uniref:probable RNA-binding protein EIF1AD n=1 Tax=Ipomoea nil TaxID=35883 RepID=UPI000900D0BC|nr:PREDICTED: probable RNA-binding protein EIF1AD [Ipomoea nil]